MSKEGQVQREAQTGHPRQKESGPQQLGGAVVVLCTHCGQSFGPAVVLQLQRMREREQKWSVAWLSRVPGEGEVSTPWPE